MSWLFSQALVEAFSADSCTAVAPFAQLNVTLTPHKFWRNDKTMEFSNLSRFGLTLQLLTESRGKELLKSYLAAFPARTLVQQEPAPASMAKEADSGSTWRGSFAKYDHNESKWKTAQCSLLGDSDEFSETWPRWGSMLNGVSYLRPIPALPICESASGLLPNAETFFHTPNCAGLDGGSNSRKALQKRMWQTPVADDAVNRAIGKYNSRGEPKLSAEVKLWPTPTVCGNHNQPGSSKNAGWGLSSAVKRWPTPVASASASKGSSPGTLVRKSGKSRENDRLDHAVMASDGGQLNPEWVEWLMGWPIGWTELKPLAMDKYQEWRQQHGIC